VLQIARKQFGSLQKAELFLDYTKKKAHLLAEEAEKAQVGGAAGPMQSEVARGWMRMPDPDGSHYFIGFRVVSPVF
jgi:hypothetical protein